MKLIIFCLLVIISINYIYCNHDYVNFPNKYQSNYPTIHDKHKIKYEMMLHIKDVLNMERENRTLDEYVRKIFNLDNPNPNYIFVLPDVHNKTVVFKRSDFKHAVFPNVTSTNKFKRNSDYNLSTFYKNINKTLKGERYGPQLQLPPVPDLYDTNDEDLSQLHNEKLVSNFYDDQIDEETKKVVAENVRTERNFLRYMDELNKNAHINRNTWPNDDKNRDKSIYYNPWSASAGLNRNKNGSKKLSPQQQKQYQQQPDTKLELASSGDKGDEWDLLGLSGWSGGLKVVHDDISENYASSTSSNIFTNPGNTAFQYQNDYGLKPPTKPIKNYNPQQQHKEPIKQISVINDNQNYNNLRNNNNNPSKPRFPVTSPRAQHKDDDVFIARANDPFGHSTKWSNISEQQSHRDGRSKRGVVQLYSMIKCTTGCDPLIYKGYGCYCGFLGSGRALDGIDRCCKMHDYCYSVSGCPMFLEYFVPYLWKCYKGRPLCALDHGEWGGPGSCASRLCECDRVLSKCLRRYLCPRKRNVCTASPFRLFQNFIMDLTDI